MTVIYNRTERKSLPFSDICMTQLHVVQYTLLFCSLHTTANKPVTAYSYEIKEAFKLQVKYLFIFRLHLMNVLCAYTALSKVYNVPEHKVSS
jgi:hypothetical protein